MREPSPRVSRLLIAGGLLAVAAIGGGGFLLGRARLPVPAPASPAPLAAAPAPAPPPAEALVDAVLARADLIALGNAAADAAASGRSPPEQVEAAAGRRFRLYLPFGCDGPADAGSGAPLRWRYDAEAGVLRVHAAPMTWPVADWLGAAGQGARTESVEALEGFWVARPWSSRETCAGGVAVTAATGAEPITLTGQTLGVAQLVTADTPRQLRRGDRPYEAVVRVAPEALRLDAGLRLRLDGRIGTFPGGTAARCVQPGGPEQRPACLFAVSLEEVAVENAVTGEALATWAATAADRPD